MNSLIKSTLILVSFTYFGDSLAQCNLQVLTTQSEILCGDCATLSAFGNINGTVAFEEDFNSGSPSGWSFTQNNTIANNTCSTPSPDGTNFMWMGAASTNPRDMTTAAYNLSPGGTICFEMRYAEQGGPSPCEGPDEPDEGVFLQYSTNGGATWTTINYWDPNGGTDPTLTAWNTYCAVIPAGAQTTNTMIQWHQEDVSGAANDHWGIDNVEIILNDPTSEIVWNHDGYSYGLGNPGGDNPTQVCPLVDTDYSVTISNSAGATCTQTVSIVVVNPTITVNAGPDLEVCPGECIALQATADVIKDPGGPTTFSNIQPEDFDASFLGGAGVNVNVVGLNMTTILPGSIQEICIPYADFTGLGGLQGGVESLSLAIVCPDGTSITLVQSGDAPAGNPGFFGVGGTPSWYDNVCFVPSGAINLTSIADNTPGAMPISGTYNSNEPFDDLVGCSANGLWSLTIGSTAISGNGTLDGWSITFNDIPLLGTADISWSAASNLSDPTILNPVACPSADETYTITVSDINGCATETDEVTVTISNTCCALLINNVATSDPSCGATDGSITITTSGSITGLLFSIDGGITTQSTNVFTGLAEGNYNIYVIDDAGCPATSVAILNQSASVNIDNVSVIEPGCGLMDGEILITASGGTTPLTYSIDNGITQVAGNNFSNLAGAVYNIYVEDASGCSVTTTITLIEPNQVMINSVIVSAEICPEDCNGSITISGTNVVNYSIDGGINFQGNGDFTKLCPGIYNVMVEDANGCQITVVESINPAPEIDAEFTFTPESAPNTAAQFETTNLSYNATTYQWYTNTGETSIEENPVFSYDASILAGEYPICLIATNANACVDTVCYNLTITQDNFYYIPNSFTPNADGNNDFFYVKGIGLENAEFELIIFDRWGELIYTFDSYFDSWDGTSGGSHVPQGTYVWKLSLKWEGELRAIDNIGHVNVLR